MLYMVFASALSVLAFFWAKNADSRTIAQFHQLGNAAGILTRVLTLFDAIRLVAEWFKSGANGLGPLSVPVTARQQSTAPPSAPNQFIPGGVSSKPVTKITELNLDDLPPRMVNPSAII